ncbi:MAG: hypothetical protein KDD66_14755 [Bdellovibrionales bacterium]|nr:hypothetical protein [Bdellovibrionales bacterium]
MSRELFLRFVVGLNGAADTTDFSIEDAAIRGRFGEDTEIRIVPLALAEVGDPAFVVFSDLQGRESENVVGFGVHGKLDHVAACVDRFCRGGDCGVDYTLFGAKFRVRNTRTSTPIGVMPRPDDGTTLGWLKHPEVEVFGIGPLEALVLGGDDGDIEMRVGSV